MTLSRYAIKERLPSLRRQVAKEMSTDPHYLHLIIEANMGYHYAGARQPLTISEVRAIEYQWLLDHRDKRRADMSIRSTG
jgi:hypothetical protein